MLRTVFADLLHKPALDINRTELQLAADGWQSASSASLAVRILRPCLKWGEKRGYVRAGIADLDQRGKLAKRERVLTAAELKAVWPHLRGPHGQVVQWLLWTGCRLNEAAGMRWSEIRGEEWTVPASRTKNRRGHVVPLPRQAVELLASLGPGEPGALVFPTSRGSMLSNWDRETKRLQALSGTSAWHRHDLRRTVATLLGNLGVAPHVVSAVLGHAHIAEGATAVYARSRYKREHREALQMLADKIEQMVASEQKIIQMAGYR